MSVEEDSLSTEDDCLVYSLKSLGEITKLDLSMDADSIYLYNMKFAIIILMLGPKVGYRLPTVRSNNNVMHGSRFSVNLKYLKETVLKSYKGRKMQKVGLHRFPNQLMFYVSFEGLCNIEGAVYISLLNVPKIRKTTYFRNEETCLLNVLLNEAIATLNKDRENPKYQGKMEQISRIGMFRSKVAGKYSSNFKSHASSSITSNVMVHFGYAFDEVLERLKAMSNEDKIKFCTKKARNGMFFDKGDVRVQESSILKAIETFSKGVVFSFSLAGCKHAFKDFTNCRKQFVIRTSSNLSVDLGRRNALNEEINAWVKETTLSIRNHLMHECFDFPKVAPPGEEKVDEYFNTRFYFDIGLDVSCPLNGINLVPRKWGVQTLFDTIKEQLSRPEATRPTEVRLIEQSQVRILKHFRFVLRNLWCHLLDMFFV